MSWVKLYFQVNKEILLVAIIFNIVGNVFIHPNLIMFVSSFIGIIMTTMILFVVLALYYWLRYELPHKVKLFRLRLKLFWKFMNLTEDKLKYFEFVINKANEIYERREKQ